MLPLTAVENGGMTSLYRSAVTNFASGAEYYFTPAFPLRVGAFTNFDARPPLQIGKLNAQGERIDYYGASASFSWAQPSSQVSVGSMYQLGSGKANKLGTTAQQDIESTSLSLQFSARHMF
jgi:hypothetical protein